MHKELKCTEANLTNRKKDIVKEAEFEAVMFMHFSVLLVTKFVVTYKITYSFIYVVANFSLP